MEYTDEKEIAVCNLASISLPRFVNKAQKSFDFAKLHEVTKIVTRNLNRVIDVNHYPLEETRYSNMKNRPIGIGIQGMADTLTMLRLAFDEEEATNMNELIFETIYHAAMEMSMELAKEEGHYESYPGSPLSQGKFQFDLWGVTPSSGRYDWEALRKDVL
jgi:ribonucleoside-diphosphate reductase alpha chain